MKARRSGHASSLRPTKHLPLLEFYSSVSKPAASHILRPPMRSHVGKGLENFSAKHFSWEQTVKHPSLLICKHSIRQELQTARLLMHFVGLDPRKAEVCWVASSPGPSRGCRVYSTVLSTFKTRLQRPYGYELKHELVYLE